MLFRSPVTIKMFEMGTFFLIHDDYPPKAHLPGHGPIQGWLMTLVLLGAPFSHTVSTSEALVRENASISFGSCPMLMGHLLRKASAIVEPW